MKNIFLLSYEKKYSTLYIDFFKTHIHTLKTLLYGIELFLNNNVI